jgi:hypothetical protein
VFTTFGALLVIPLLLWGNPRFHQPLVPLMAVSAGALSVALVERVTGRRTARATGADEVAAAGGAAAGGASGAAEAEASGGDGVAGGPPGADEPAATGSTEGAAVGH